MKAGKSLVRLKDTQKASFLDCIEWGCGEIIPDTSWGGRRQITQRVSAFIRSARGILLKDAQKNVR